MITIILRWLLKRSIQKEGVKALVIINQDNVVLDGNHRVMIARELGSQIEVIRIVGVIEKVDPCQLKTYYD